MNKKVKDILPIQATVVLYSVSGIFSKLASRHAFLSFDFLLMYACEILALGVYAFFWQQIIRRHDLSLAYLNRSASIIWSMLWAALLFGEKITLQNAVGVLIIMLGVMVVNTEEKGEEKAP